MHRDTALAVVANVDVLDASGLVVARLEDCESTIDTGLTRAFRRNHRAATQTQAAYP